MLNKELNDVKVVGETVNEGLRDTCSAAQRGVKPQQKERHGCGCRPA
jgi:hypothetical protein